MKEEKKITQSDIEQATVRLHPSQAVFHPASTCRGICVYRDLLPPLPHPCPPGIRKNGSYLVFDGAPAKSAVYVGDSFKGSSGQIFIPAGTYPIRIEHSGFLPETKELKVGGRLFGSLFFPRRAKVGYSLSAEAPMQFLQSAYMEYSGWSLSGKPSALYQIPAVLSEAASALAGSGALAKPAASAAAQALPDPLSFAKDVLSATTSAESARDGLGASVLLSSNGMPGPLSLVAAARTVLAAFGQGKAGTVWLADVLPKNKAIAKNIAAGGADKATPEGNAAAPSQAPRPRGSLSLAGHDFVLFSSGELQLGGEAPSGSHASYAAVIPIFGIAKTEVTNREWLAFLSANPAWKAENRAALIEKGLADDSYLADWNGLESGAGDKPVTNVSWNAASAYCAWLTSRSQGAYKVVLPSEAMWEAAARAGLSDPASLSEKKARWADGAALGPARSGESGYSAAGLADMFGNVWEWTAEAYHPYQAFADGQLAGDEKTVRGGSWANAVDSITLYSRGGMASTHASAFLGFRPAIVER